MRIKTTLPALLLASALSLLLAAPADARSVGGGGATKARAQKGKAKRRQPVFSGYQVPASKLRIEPVERPSGHLKLHNVNFHTDLEVDLYDDAGNLDAEALDQLNHFWRCRRTGTEKPIEPRLFEILSTIQDHFDGRTLELVSGFRNQKHTASFHFHGTASDVRILGVSDRALHDFVATLDSGGMGLGIYPRAGFIHVDVRPEASYRWTDYSPPGGKAVRSRKARKHAPNT